MLARAPGGLAVILALALLLRIGVIVATPDFVPIFDAGDYDRHAISIADGHGYADEPGAPGEPTALRAPLYAYALAGVHVVGGGWTAGRLLGAVLGVTAVLLVFLVARRLWDGRVAHVAAAVAAVFPPLVLLNASLLSEPLFLVLVLAAVLALLRYRDGQALGWAAVAGILCGLAALSRNNGLLLVLAALLAVWTVRPRVGRRAWVASATVVACAALTVTPWVVRNTIAFDRFVGVSTQSGYGLAATYNGESRDRGHPGRPVPTHQLDTFRDLYARRDLDEAELGGRLTSRALDYIRAHPGYVAETLAWNTLRVFDVVHDQDFDFTYEGLVLQAAGVGALVSPLVSVSLYLLVLLAALGIVAELRRPRASRAPPFVWAVPLLMVLPAIGVWGLSRYRAPVDPFLAMLAALGIVALVDAVRSRAT